MGILDISGHRLFRVLETSPGKMGEEERRDEEVMKSLLALELVQFLLGCCSFHVLVSGLLRVIVVSMGLCCEHSPRVSEVRLLLRGLRSPVAICLVDLMI